MHIIQPIKYDVLAVLKQFPSGKWGGSGNNVCNLRKADQIIVLYYYFKFFT